MSATRSVSSARLFIGANIVVRLQLRRPPPSASITDILRTAGAELAVHGVPGPVTTWRE